MSIEWTEDPEGLASLTKKLASAYEDVDYIQKTGEVSFGKTHYNYAEEKEIVQKVRKAFNERGIFVYQSQGESDVKGNVTTTTHEYLFVCADTGGWVRCKWQGTGQDSGDKGIYKAHTGAQKYFYMKNMLIPTGDDPERDHEEQLRKEREAQAKAEEQRMKDLATQRNRFHALVSKAYEGSDDKADKVDAFREFIKGAYQVESFKDISLGKLRTLNNTIDDLPVEDESGSKPRREWINDKLEGE